MSELSEWTALQGLRRPKPMQWNDEVRSFRQQRRDFLLQRLVDVKAEILRIGALTANIIEIRTKHYRLPMPRSQAMLMLQLFAEELGIEAKEDDLLVHHDGRVPETVMEEHRAETERIYARFRSELGVEELARLLKGVDMLLWGNITKPNIEPSSGGGVL